MKKPRKAKTFKYISPLNDVPDGHAKMMAELAEQAMLETFNIMLEVIEQRTSLFYEYADRRIKEEQKSSDMKKENIITIQQVLIWAHPYWKYATYDRNGWRLFDDEPRFDEEMNEWIMSMLGHSFHLKDLFDIQPFNGLYKDSLIKKG